jgi:uracil phosphoribosyltransferase
MFVHVSKHPLVQHKVALLRDEQTNPKLFRELVFELSQLLFVEASNDLRLMPITIKTPLADCPSFRLKDRVGIVPILRAGLGMAEAMLGALPEAIIWHLGMFRDHETHQAVWYYDKLPKEPNVDVTLIVDPMLATGGSVVEAIKRIKTWGVQRIKFIGLIAAPEGVENVQREHPDVPIYLAALDSHLNQKKYIVPGLGDAGDRQFGTS